MHAASASEKRELLLLGKILMSKQPQLARELLSAHQTADSGTGETNYSKINAYFLDFCAIHNLIPQEYTGALNKSRKTEFRKLFVATMLHIYMPDAIAATQRGAAIRIPRTHLSEGFLKQLSTTLKTDKGNTSRLIREVIVMEQAYDYFKNNVHTTITRLQTKNLTEHTR